jgi:hypothetical protein
VGRRGEGTQPGIHDDVPSPKAKVGTLYRDGFVGRVLRRSSPLPADWRACRSIVSISALTASSRGVARCGTLRAEGSADTNA